MGFIQWIEYADRHVLAVGTAAPWRRRIQIRVPRRVAQLLGGK